MPYKRILTIQDISCIGQCSMTVALPILSACCHEVCILPSAVLSTHTGGFGKPAVQKLTDLMRETVAHWKENQITFDLIYVGYLGSLEAVRIAEEIMDTMLASGGIAVVDPAMADHGKLYSGLNEAYAAAMGALCVKADVMIPNITEAAMMTGMGYEEKFEESYVRSLLGYLPGKNVLLTSVPTARGLPCAQHQGWKFIPTRNLQRITPVPAIFSRQPSAGHWPAERILIRRVKLLRSLRCGAFRIPQQHRPIGTV